MASKTQYTVRQLDQLVDACLTAGAVKPGDLNTDTPEHAVARARYQLMRDQIINTTSWLTYYRTKLEQEIARNEGTWHGLRWPWSH